MTSTTGEGGDAREHAVQRADLRPVHRLGDVQGGDGGLELVRPGAAQAQGAIEDVLALLDALEVPAAAVLVGQRDVRPVVRDARGAAGVVDEHERQQAGGLGVVGHELGQQACEADGLGAQVGAHEAVPGARR
ncbi:MAG TPA: hypothetical protein VF257_16720 [Solirubrobacteraceae bacterium]